FAPNEQYSRNHFRCRVPLGPAAHKRDKILSLQNLLCRFAHLKAYHLKTCCVDSPITAQKQKRGGVPCSTLFLTREHRPLFRKRKPSPQWLSSPGRLCRAWSSKSPRGPRQCQRRRCPRPN
ncbi:unnamed protein product, partial [Ectocarpus sp. 12 AP-2014]